LKKPTGSVRFHFISLKPKKPSQTGKNQAKPSQPEKTEPNRFEPVFVLKTKPNRTETGRFEPVSVFFLKKKIWFDYFFLIKTELNRK
jgi:hypothetical protein